MNHHDQINMNIEHASHSQIRARRAKVLVKSQPRTPQPRAPACRLNIVLTMAASVRSAVQLSDLSFQHTSRPSTSSLQQRRQLPRIKVLVPCSSSGAGLTLEDADAGPTDAMEGSPRTPLMPRCGSWTSFGSPPPAPCKVRRRAREVDPDEEQALGNGARRLRL